MTLSYLRFKINRILNPGTIRLYPNRGGVFSIYYYEGNSDKRQQQPKGLDRIVNGQKHPNHEPRVDNRWLEAAHNKVYRVRVFRKY